MAHIVTYTNPACPHCQRLEAYLSKRGGEYTDRDVTQDEAARAELAEMNAPGVPVHPRRTRDGGRVQPGSAG